MCWFLALLTLASILQIAGAVGEAYEIEGNADGTPDLPWGDINLLVITDDHSWVGGHQRKEPYLNADYGAVLSFYQHLKIYCESVDKDLYFVMNGDWIDGTGLSLNGDISSLVPLIQKMPFDVVNTGNHELYKSEVIDGMREPGGFIDWWGHRFLASNIVMADTDEPLGNRFMMLEGKNSQVLVFGFIYHLLDPADTVIVNDPADEVKDPWFEAALRENTFDAILVMAHMGVDDESITVIRDAIRAVVGDGVPIQFVAGHTHLLRWAKVDDLSTAVEAGKFLDTVGFLSFPTKQTAEITAPESYIDLFQYTFVDANVNYMKYALDGEYGFTTPDGEDLSEFIVTTQYEMGLLDIVGCAPNNYFMNRSLTDVDSLWAIYQKQVVPTQLGQDPAVNRAIIVSQDSWRYDIFEGDNTYDDVVAISPFNESIYFVGIVPCDAVNQLYEKLNADAGELYYPVLPAYILAGKLVPGEDCELYTHHFELSAISEGIQSVQPGTYEVLATNLTSTSIWIDFFRSEWPCAGQTRIHIPWLDDHKLIDENGQANKKNMAIVTSVSIVSILVFCGLLACCRYAVKQMCFGKQAVSEEEINAFKEDGQIEAEFA